MILVFDITNESSFDDLEDHFTEGNRFSARSLKFLVGNKSDLEDRQISFESAQVLILFLMLLVIVHRDRGLSIIHSILITNQNLKN